MKQKNKLIYTTKNYSLFVQDDCNRDVKNHPRLRESMTQHGWLPEHPMVVIADANGKYRIKDGGHRLTIAKELGLPVFYVVSENTEMSVAMINNAQRTWSLDDYVGSYVRQGNEQYKRLAQFATAQNLNVGIAANLLGGNGGATDKVKSGQFAVKSEGHAHNVIMVVECAAKVVNWARQSKFICAVSMILKYSRADVKVLCAKIHSHGGMMIPQTTSERFIEMLETIYNYRNQNPVALALTVKQQLKQYRADNMKRTTELRMSK